MEIYSIGFTQKSAREFFGALKAHGIERLLDVRLNNTSQLAGFAKQADLAYFLQEICGVVYEHEPLLAPTQDMLDAFKKQKGDWAAYEEAFLGLMRSRKVESAIDKRVSSKRQYSCAASQLRSIVIGDWPSNICKGIGKA